MGYGIKLMKYSILWHLVSGTFVLSNPNLLSSESYFDAQRGHAGALVESWTGGTLSINSRYLQGHLILFWVAMGVMLTLIWFENEIVSLLLSCSCLRAFYSKPMAKKEAVSDDFYDEIKPLYLIKQYRRAIEIKLYVMDFIAKNQFKTTFFAAFRTSITNYLNQVISKEKTLADKIRKLAARMGYKGFHDMEARCEAILNNLDKADRVANSRMTSVIQSYDHRDNEQYQAMEPLAKILQMSDE